MDEKNLFEVPPSLIDIIFLLLIFSLILLASGMLSGYREQGKTQKSEIPVLRYAKPVNMEKRYQGLWIVVQENAAGDSLEFNLLGEYRPGHYLTSLSSCRTWHDTLRDALGNYRKCRNGSFCFNPDRKRYFVIPLTHSEGLNKMVYIRREIQALEKNHKLNPEDISVAIQADKTIDYGVFSDIVAQCNPDSVKSVRLIGVKE